MARFGNIGKQYFDDAGDPLIAGKLYFYLSGTSTPKTTFADVNLAVANPHPVILTASGRQPDIFFDGTSRVVLTDQNDVQIEVRDPEGGNVTGNFDDWSATLIYGGGDVVVGANSLYYRSLTAGNQGNEPSANPADWQEVEFINVWNSSTTYPADATVKASNGLFYLSLSAGNVGNDPISTPAFWGATVDVTPPENILVSARLYSYDNFEGF